MSWSADLFSHLSHNLQRSEVAFDRLTNQQLFESLLI